MAAGNLSVAFTLIAQAAADAAQVLKGCLSPEAHARLDFERDSGGTVKEIMDIERAFGIEDYA